MFGAVCLNGFGGPLTEFFSSLQQIDGDCYSEVVDKMSIGTPAMQKRRETLAVS